MQIYTCKFMYMHDTYFLYDNLNIINENEWNTYLKQGQPMKIPMDMQCLNDKPCNLRIQQAENLKVLKELIIIIFINDNPLKVSVQYPVNIVNDVVLAIL